MRHAVALLPLALAMALLQSVGCGDGDERPPDLLLVTVDSLRADFLACYGGRAGVGVRMCALADEGTRYTWAFSPSPSSGPAIASILTSRYPSDHTVDASAASFLPGEIVTLAETLRVHGYATAAFVSSPELNRSRNLQQGFEIYDDRTMRAGTSNLPRRSAEDTTEAALSWLREASEPWFVWVHYREPHGPYRSAVFTDDPTEARGGPNERLRLLPTATGRGGIPGYQAIPGLFTRQGYEARYRGEVRVVDAQLSRLIAGAQERGDRLGIIVTADHGEAFGEQRWYFSHGHSVSLDQIRVPLFWRPPGGAAPNETRVAVSTLDVAPTLLRAAGLGVPESFEGWALPSADDPPGAPQLARAVFAEHPEHVAVITGENVYERLRVPTEDTGPDVSNEFLRAAAARTASLGTRDALPSYSPARPSGITPLLEPRLAEFLQRQERAAASSLPQPVLPPPVPPMAPATPVAPEATPDAPESP